ncbi:LytTR family DNA-binding domain-containing protein [Roseovarius mucosus]|uniref:LytTR family DNA-binding domain-containing protein n=1 Tax=Roseovarius mucosus TaxID=215743 RepID=UPI0035D066DA
MLINAYEMGTDKGGTLNWSDLRLHFVDTFSLLFSSVTFYVWTATLGFAVLAGPFGSYDTMSWPIRTAYWAAVITAAILVGFAARATMRALLGGRHPALFDLGASFLVGIALGPLIWFLRGWMDPILAHEDLNPIKITLNSFLIACGVFVVRRQIGAEAPTSYWSRPATKPETPAQTRLHRRLSCPPFAEIHRLSANNHYVEVATSDGIETLRLRLVDAIEEMEPVAGICTHRSHWVAFAAISGTERESGGKIFLLLKNGDRVPVSRKYRPNLEAAGVIDSLDAVFQAR